MSLERYQPKNNVSQLDNRPKLTADDLKKEFDKAENNIGEFINNKLIPSIETELAEVNKQIEEKADTSTLENQIDEVNERINNFHDKVIPEIEKSWKNKGTVKISKLPQLTSQDAGQVFYISHGGQFDYTTQMFDAVVESHDDSGYLFLVKSPQIILDIYSRGRTKLKVFAVAKNANSNGEKVKHRIFTAGENVWKVEFPSSTGFDETFEKGEQIEIYAEVTLDANDGDCVEWDGYSWINISGYKAHSELKELFEAGEEEIRNYITENFASKLALEEIETSLRDEIGDIESLINSLHNYAMSLINGGAE